MGRSWSQVCPAISTWLCEFIFYCCDKAPWTKATKRRKSLSGPRVPEGEDSIIAGRQESRQAWWLEQEAERPHLSTMSMKCALPLANPHNFSKQCHPLGTTCLNTWAYMRGFSFQPSQWPWPSHWPHQSLVFFIFIVKIIAATPCINMLPNMAMEVVLVTF